jgi:starch synthase
VLHAHDWQAGLAPVYLRLEPARARTASVMTIHNLAYRGLFAKQVLPELGVPWDEFTIEGLEFYDQVSLLKGGLARADVVTTVSPSYAEEIVEPIAGEGLHAFLGALPKLVGIVNGIDAEAWNPASDAALPARYAAADPAGKATCRRALAEEYGLKLGPETVLAVMVSRLADQKGCDIVADLVPELHGLDARLIVLGAGDATLEDRFRWLGRVFREHIAVHVGFDVARARRIYAGGDLFLMPSRFEPCGIGQLYAMRYGALPVVHAVGGLRDTVADGVTGFTFAFADLLGLRWGVERALATYRDHRADWRRMVTAAMSRDSSWAPSAQRYMDEYRAAVQARR